MTEKGKWLATRWATPNHDGLTPAHLEGAVRLGWMTQAEVDDLTAQHPYTPEEP